MIYVFDENLQTDFQSNHDLEPVSHSNAQKLFVRGAEQKSEEKTISSKNQSVKTVEGAFNWSVSNKPTREKKYSFQVAIKQPFDIYNAQHTNEINYLFRYRTLKMNECDSHHCRLCDVCNVLLTEWENTNAQLSNSESERAREKKHWKVDTFFSVSTCGQYAWEHLIFT